VEFISEALVAVAEMAGLSHLTPTQKFLLAVSLPITLIFLYFLFHKNSGLFRIQIFCA